VRKQLGILILLAFVILIVAAVHILERHAEPRIANRIPGDTISVSIWTMEVDWTGLNWEGLQAASANLDVPFGAAFRHFATGKPVDNARITLADGRLDLLHPTARPIKSILVLGGLQQTEMLITSATMQIKRIDVGWNVIASDVITDIGRFQYSGHIVNGRFRNGTLIAMDVEETMIALMITMAQLQGGKATRDPHGVSITW
jgi:hypothetical protein